MAFGFVVERLAVWLGAVLSLKRKLLNRPFHLLVPPAPVVLLALGPVVLGHDLGTMLVMAMLVAGAMWVAGVPRRWFALAGGAGTIGVIALTVTSENRMRRISAWLHGTCEGATCDQSNMWWSAQTTCPTGSWRGSTAWARCRASARRRSASRSASPWEKAPAS